MFLTIYKLLLSYELNLSVIDAVVLFGFDAICGVIYTQLWEHQRDGTETCRTSR